MRKAAAPEAGYPDTAKMNASEVILFQARGARFFTLKVSPCVLLLHKWVKCAYVDMVQRLSLVCGRRHARPHAPFCEGRSHALSLELYSYTKEEPDELLISKTPPTA